MPLYVLLAGINNYQNTDLPRLLGPDKDVDRVGRYLAAHFEADQLQVETLLNEKATKEAIVQAFTQHLGKAGKKDQVLFYFSGHGAIEAPHIAFGHLAKDDRFETLVCYDSLYNDGTTLADKELRYLIAQLSKTCDNITILLDCCHSGGITRNVLPVKNADMILKRLAVNVPARKYNDFIFADAIPETTVKSATSLEALLPEGNHIQLAACMSEQSAWEIRGSGIFTANLLSVLLQTQGSINYNDLYSRVKYLVINRFDQVPNLYIKAANKQQYGSRLFLGGQATDKTTGRANLVFNNPLDCWLLDKGAIHGVRKLSEGYDLEVCKTVGELPVTRAKIVAILPDHCRVEFEDANVSDKSYHTTVPGLYQKTLSVFVTGEEKGVKNITSYYKAKKELYSKEGIQLVDGTAQADYVIIAHQDQYYVMLPTLAEVSDNMQPVIRPVKDYTDDSAAELLSYCLSIARWEYMKSLENPDTALKPFPFEIVFHEKDGSGQLQPDADNAIISSYEVERQGNESVAVKRFTVSITNPTANNYYCSFIYLGTAFNITTDLLKEEVMQVEKNGAVWLYDGEDAELTLEDSTELYNRQHELAWALVIASTDKFEIGDVKQDALPMPQKGGITRSLGGVAKGFTKRSKDPLPPADWCTKLIRLQFGNPFYQKNDH